VTWSFLLPFLAAARARASSRNRDVPGGFSSSGVTPRLCRFLADLRHLHQRGVGGHVGQGEAASVDAEGDGGLHWCEVHQLLVVLERREDVQRAHPQIQVGRREQRRTSSGWGPPRGPCPLLRLAIVSAWRRRGGLQGAVSLLPGGHPFCLGVDAWKEQRIQQIARKNILNEAGARGKKKKLLNS